MGSTLGGSDPLHDLPDDEKKREVNITIKAPPSAVALYHSLLMKEWTQGTLEKVLRLLWEEISENGELDTLSFRDVLCPDVAVRPLRGVHQEVVQRTQSLLFLMAVHYLLPALKEHGHMAEHDCAINALFMHIHTVWSLGDQQEHAYYLRSVLMDYLGDKDGAAESLRLSVALTPLDDESYLTQVQQYAFALLDSGRVRQSLEFLLATYRNAPEPYLDELKEMTMCIYRRGAAKAI
ncbi:MAG TPA: hypothetical protein VMV69_03175 [Pirellulales bacterium]|nr:hypothetical protein [Pirellulales bacterium]